MVSVCMREGQVTACLEHTVKELHMDRWHNSHELNVRVLYCVKQYRNVCLFI